MSSVAADGAQLGVTALEDFIAQRGTHVGPAVEEGAGELEDERQDARCKIMKRTFSFSEPATNLSPCR